MKPCPKCWGTGNLKDHKRLGAIVRKARQARGESLKATATRLGITECFMSLLETGKRSWTKPMYLRALGRK